MQVFSIAPAGMKPLWVLLPVALVLLLVVSVLALSVWRSRGFANGESALLSLTDRRKAVHVPTALGYSLLISPDDPDAFVSALRALGSR